MKDWKEFDNNQLTHSMAHYLMAIQGVHKRQGYARVTDVARELEITPGSASVSIKTLKQRGFVDEDHNRFLMLSQEGERLAQEIRINNRLLVQFLTEILELPESQAHIDACKVEHLVSGQTRKRLMSFMQFMHEDKKTVKCFLESWKDHEFECPGKNDCPLCEKDDTCLAEDEEP
jgi:DtxR family transcriptional regulator, Mn-dependent transcriptional regulator